MEAGYKREIADAGARHQTGMEHLISCSGDLYQWCIAGWHKEQAEETVTISTRK